MHTVPVKHIGPSGIVAAASISDPSPRKCCVHAYFSGKELPLSPSIYPFPFRKHSDSPLTLSSPSTECLMLYTACLHSNPGIYRNGPMMSYLGSANFPNCRIPLICTPSVSRFRRIPFAENKFSPICMILLPLLIRNCRTGNTLFQLPDSVMIWIEQDSLFAEMCTAGITAILPSFPWHRKYQP